MPILVDFNQVMLASLFVGIGNHHNIEPDENILRHMFLNSLRANRKKFHQDYGELVICADGANSWRKEYFPFYKAGRKTGRDESDLDWNELFRIINKIRQELDEHFPYKVLHFHRVEADDIIGAITHAEGKEISSKKDILILSGDKDFAQLQVYANVAQYNPVRKNWIEVANPDTALREHILRGDGGDGIPNVLSDDDCLVENKRQKSLTKKRMAEMMNMKPDEFGTLARNYHRNELLIDLSKVPETYKSAILEEYYKPKDIGRGNLRQYFMDYKLKQLMSSIGDF